MDKQPVIEWERDSWRVVGEGMRDGDVIYLHLASTSRYQVGRKRHIPLQIVDWVPLSLLNEARISAGLEPLP